MPFVRSLLVPMLMLALWVGAGPARAQCPLNPAGGPNELDLAALGAGSDLDIGTKAKLHNISVPPTAEIRFCLSGCDLTTQPVCHADAGNVTVAGAAFTAPVPLLVSNGLLGVCVATTFAQPPSGTADVQTGALDITATIDAKAYVVFGGANICPVCSGAQVGAGGTCSNQSTACRVDQVLTVGSQTYSLSRDCLPNGIPVGSVAVDAHLGTDTATLTSCTAASNDCGGSACTEGSCNAAGSGSSGIGQACCANDASTPCFPPLPISRDGSAAPPAPLWPDATYPKTGTSGETLAGIECVPATGNGQVDGQVGLPGPVALLLPVSQRWSGNAVPVTTTSITLPAGSTTTTLAPQCTPGSPPVGCDTSNPCRVPTCVPPGVCQYADLTTGPESVTCRANTIGGLLDRSGDNLFGGAKPKARIAQALQGLLGRLDALAGAKGKQRQKVIKQARRKLKAFVAAVNKSKKLDPTLRHQLLDQAKAVSTQLQSVS
jgi:hypothetical protein